MSFSELFGDAVYNGIMFFNCTGSNSTRQSMVTELVHSFPTVGAWSLFIQDFEIQTKFEQGSKTQGIESLTKARFGTVVSQ